MPDDLNALFPQINDILTAWDSRTPPPDGGATDPSHRGWTDDQVEAAIQQRLSSGQRLVTPTNGSQAQLPVNFMPGQGQLPQSLGPARVEAAGGAGTPSPTPPAPPAPPVPPVPAYQPPPVAPPAPPPGPAPYAPGPGSPPPAPPSYAPPGAPPSPTPAYQPPQPPPPGTYTSPEAAAAEFQRRLQDPQFAQFVRERVAAQPPPAPTTPPLPTPPAPGTPGTVPVAGGPPSPSPSPYPTLPPLPMAESQLDMTDPTTAAIYRHMEAQQRYLDSMSQRLQVHDSYLTQQQQEASNAYMARAREQFQSSYSVTPEQVVYLERVAANLGVLPSLLSGVDPTTGQYSPPDPISALHRAMEIAYWTVPEYREVELQRQASQSFEDRQRKSKLGGLSGSSGSVPRNPPQPTNPQERREAMMTEVGQMMQGSWAGGN